MSSRVYRSLFMAAFVSMTLIALPAAVVASHSWGNPAYHWARTSNPFVLLLGDNISTAWDIYLANTSADWTLSTVLNTKIVASQTKPRTCKATAGRAEVCSEKYGNNGWLGIASIWISGSHITQGTVKLNDTYFNTSKYNTPAWRNLVMCQEVGHIFGLDHQDETFDNPNLETCMDYTSDPSTNQQPNAHDYLQLEAIYAHLDNTTTVSSTAPSGSGKGRMPPAANGSESDDPIQIGTAQWGKLIRSTNNGRTELFELDLGGGHKMLTHVIWADPEDQPGPQRGRR